MRVLWLSLLGGCFVTEAELERALDRDEDGFLPVQTGGDDCNEGRADIHPDAVEICGDGIDNNCDGVPDDDGIGASTWFRDADDDGFGVDETITACSEPEGYAPLAGDCDDTDSTINPAAADACDGIDQNCNGLVDEEVVFTLRFRDDDGDGYGLEDDTLESCGVTPGYSLVGGDCDDSDSGVSPGAVDLCDGVDQDCDSVIDDDAVLTLYFEDADGDGVGTSASFVEDCAVPAGYSALNGDCDDTDPSVQPGVLDGCDGVDQDCDGAVDEDAAFEVWFEDGDGDALGGGSQVSTCDGAPPGFVASSGDCDDTDALVTIPLWYADGDGDGYGTGVTASACVEPSGFTALDGDCDDTRENVNPGRNEVCNNGRDDDCDPVTDCRLTGNLYADDANVSVVAPLGSQLDYVGDVVGSTGGDWVLGHHSEEVFEGPVPDFSGPSIILPCAYGVRQNPDFTGDGRPDLTCVSADGRLLALGSGSLVEVTSVAGSEGGVVVADGPIGAGFWAQIDDEVRHFPGLLGAHDGTNPTTRLRCAEGAVRSFSVSEGGMVAMNCEGVQAEALIYDPAIAGTYDPPTAIERVPLPLFDFSGLLFMDIVGVGETLAHFDADSSPFFVTRTQLHAPPWTFPLSSPDTTVESLPNEEVYSLPLGDLDGDGRSEFGVFGTSGTPPRLDVVYGGSEQSTTDATLHLVLDPDSQIVEYAPLQLDLNDDGRADITVGEITSTEIIWHIFYGQGQ